MQIAIVAQMFATRAGIKSLINSDRLTMGRVEHQIIFDGATLLDLHIEKPDVDLLILVEDAISNAEILDVTDSYAGEISILVLSNQFSSIRFLRTLPVRCWGLLPLDANASELITAVNALEQGLIVGEPNLLKGLFSHQINTTLDDPPSMIEDLTQRELEVLEYLSLGLANKQIAITMDISEHTVKFHLSSIYSKMGVTNRAEAVRYGIQHGLVSL